MINFSHIIYMSYLTVNAFGSINETIKEAYKIAAEVSMKEAALNVKKVKRKT